MARQFNADSWYRAATVGNQLSGVTISISFWLYWDAYANDDQRCLYYGFTASQNGTWEVIPNYNTGTWAFRYKSAAGTYTVTIARPSAAAWHHFVIVFNTAGAVQGRVDAIYVDGASVSITESAAVTTAAMVDRELFVMEKTAVQLGEVGAAGRFAEMAIWLIGLTAAQALDLFNGLFAVYANATIPKLYWLFLGKIGGGSGNEVDVVASQLLTHALAASPYVAHPKRISYETVAPAAGGTARSRIVGGV